jgi:hypothetical protein
MSCLSEQGGSILIASMVKIKNINPHLKKSTTMW